MFELNDQELTMVAGGSGVQTTNGVGSGGYAAGSTDNGTVKILSVSSSAANHYKTAAISGTSIIGSGKMVAVTASTGAGASSTSTTVE
jgi:hypothetical protein